MSTFTIKYILYIRNIHAGENQIYFVLFVRTGPPTNFVKKIKNTLKIEGIHILLKMELII